MGPTILLRYQTWDLPSSSDTRHGTYHPPQIPRHGTYHPPQILNMGPSPSPLPVFMLLTSSGITADLFKPVHLRTYPLPPNSTVLTSSVRQRNMYNWQAGSMHPTGMLFGLCRVETCLARLSQNTRISKCQYIVCHLLFFFSWFVHFSA